MSIASKLQLKEGETVRLVNAPKDLDLGMKTAGSGADALLVFVRNQAELGKHAEAALDHAADDRLTWIAYPKAGQLDTDLNRDVLWSLLEGKGVRPVRQVALDDTWSALRFRPGP
jgi:hypothetical protein